MMYRQTKLLVILFLLVFTVQSQDFKFGKVSEEELKEQFNPADSAAVASYLYKYRITYFNYNQNTGFEMITDVHERIKIYTKEGFDYATKKINLYKDGNSKEQVSNLKAYTFNLTGNSIEEDKLRNDGIFDVEMSSYFDQTSFTMPNIKEGSVIEYKYTVVSPFISNVEDFKLQHDIPIKQLLGVFEAPEYFNFRVNTKGYLMVAPKVESQPDRIIFNSKSRTGYTNTTTSYNSSTIEYTKNISTYEMANIPALKEEPHVNNINNYRAAVSYELAFTKFPNSPLEHYSTTWEDVVKTIYKSSSFGSELNRTGYYDKDLDELLESISDPMEKAMAIFDFVKSTVTWNGNYGKYTNDGVKKAYNENVGNVAEINLMLTSMLRYAGLEANPVLVSTRDNGIPLFPTREGYDYVICGLVFQGNTLLLDATAKNSVPNVLPFRVLNWNGRMIEKDGNSTLVDLLPNDAALKAISLNVNIAEDGGIQGKMRSTNKGHTAMFYRDGYMANKKEEYIEELENKYGGMEISEFEVVNASDLMAPISETYSFIKDKQVEVIGDRLYFSPLFFLKTTENPFKLEKREFPIDFGFASTTKFIVNVNLPEGYKIETAPEPISVMLPEGLGAFRYNVSVNANGLQLLVSTDINKSIISAANYDFLKNYYKQMIEKMNERVVLSKI
ncbi:transglutaminase domain-containing protein [Sediminicola sp. 1XM1-17]|uniref:transglutaminase domain-containing protein n=1 Tax=Sediminicola sp. 1XM1-17 TaxID=3127702 RepID=UPI003077EC72